MPMRNLCFVIVICGISAVAAGCGGGADSQVLYPVAGVLNWDDGKPVADATVTFTVAGETKEKLQQGGTAKTNGQGEFTILTSTGQSGLAKGKYKIMVAAGKVETNSASPEEAKKALMARYGSGQQGQSKSPTAGEQSDSTIIPSKYSLAETTPLEWEVKGVAEDKAMKLTLQKS